VSDYERSGDTLARSKAIGERYALTFRAGDVHRERTGVHARLEVAVNGVVLAWGVLNTDKDEERVRLANSAGKQLNNGHGEVYPNAFLKKDLDDFCRGLWDAEVARFEPAYEGGLEPAPPDFILEPFMLRGGGTIIFAPPGRGKSWTTMLMAVSIDAGRSDIWPVAGPSRTLIINLERSGPQYMRRIGAVNRALGLRRERPIAVLHARGRSLRDVIEGARRFIRREQIEVVILDSISRSGMGELNEGQTGSRIMDALNGLAESWLAIGHTPRASGDHVTGTMQFDAAADLMVKLSSEQEEDGPLGVCLELTKRNDVPYYKPRILALEFDPSLGFSGYRDARHGEFPTLESGRKVSALQQLKDWLLDQPQGLGDASTAADETGLNRSNIAQLFRNREHFVFVRKEGRQALYGVKGSA
jgi:hypothetical protein